MSEQNTEFENWYNNKLAECRTNNDMVLHKKLFQYTDFYKHGYEAATAEANKRIAELEGEVAELKEQLAILKPHKLCDTSCLLSCSMEADYAEKQYLENQQLQASNNTLREALEEMVDAFKHMQTAFNDCVFDKAHKALSTTPAQSLQAFENEVIEKCAKVADAMPMKDEKAHHKYRSSDDSKAMAWDITFAIRALKEVK